MKFQFCKILVLLLIHVAFISAQLSTPPPTPTPTPPPGPSGGPQSTTDTTTTATPTPPTTPSTTATTTATTNTAPTDATTPTTTNELTSTSTPQTTYKSVCDQPKKKGPCTDYTKRFYFNSKTEKCMKFVYGGCQGNRNNFKSLEDCHAMCPNVCHLPSDRGLCEGTMTRYYFDIESSECKEFIFGGCQGNDNNFEAISECQKICENAVPTATNVCDQPQKTGPCLAEIPRFYFNSKREKCEKFIYGGCKGNGNNFETLADCKITCVNVCKLSKETGPCRGSFNRYYFKKSTGKCMKFIYGGCQGNGNNFATETACEYRCKNQKSKKRKH